MRNRIFFIEFLHLKLLSNFHVLRPPESEEISLTSYISYQNCENKSIFCVFETNFLEKFQYWFLIVSAPICAEKWTREFSQTFCDRQNFCKRQNLCRIFVKCWQKVEVFLEFPKISVQIIICAKFPKNAL